VIKDCLLKEQESRCAICGMVNEWRGFELVLILDHIDGDASNNRRDNLRLICPNCDSQLETYKGRNVGNGRHARRERYAAGLSY
jgi:RNA polymerase subunit RPABC4/transcription elongation factor Spt4